MSRPRWLLHLQAEMWRILMGLGMFFHRMAPPRPPKPDFIRTIPSTISGRPGNIALMFYSPLGYNTQRQLWHGRLQEEELQNLTGGVGGNVKGKGKIKRSTSVGDRLRRRSSTARRWGGYPVVINFHGGGFTLGTAKDDARWCKTVVDECNALVVSVDYRLAPEHPFPTAVEDGVDAVMWIHQNAEDFGIDKDKIALSGFSSGGNMAFTVPLRLWDELMDFPRDIETGSESSLSNPFNTENLPTSSNTFGSIPQNAGSSLTVPLQRPTRLYRSPTKTGVRLSQEALSQLADISIRAIVPWYPSLDYTRTREQRRATTVRKDQDLPALFTDLFDESYLHPPIKISLDSPYLSPGVAPSSLLRSALPQEIILHTCEWDMLLDEGKAFYERLISPEIGKNVWYKMVEGVPHGWDKAPNPWKPTSGVREHYLAACKELRRVFNEKGGLERRVESGMYSAAPRGSVRLVR